MNAADWLLISELWKNTMQEETNVKVSRGFVRYVEEQNSLDIMMGKFAHHVQRVEK